MQEFLVTTAKSIEDEYNQIHSERLKSKEIIKEQQNEIKEAQSKLKKAKQGVGTKEVYPCKLCKNKYYISEKALQSHYLRRHPHSENHAYSSTNSDAEIKKTLEKEISKIHELLNTFNDKIGEVSKKQEDLANKSTKEILQRQIKDLETQIHILEEDKYRTINKQALSYTMEPLVCNIERIKPTSNKSPIKARKSRSEVMSLQPVQEKKVAIITDIEKVEDEESEGSLDFSIETPEKEKLKEAIIEDVSYIKKY
jgi:hypothetical protein